MTDNRNAEEFDALLERLKILSEKLNSLDNLSDGEKEEEMFKELLEITMKLRRISYPHITELDWTNTNPAHLKSGTDKFYAALADRIQNAFLDTPLEPNTPGSFFRYAAMGLTAYFEDLISDFGVWNAVKEIYKSSYGTLLPFYDTSHDDYLPDDINMEDLKFIIWQAFCRTGQNEARFFSPYSAGVEKLAEVAFDILVDSFDDAPAANRIFTLIKKDFTSPDPIALRTLGLWLSVDFPLTASPFMREHLKEAAENILEVHRANGDFAFGMKEAEYTMEADLGWDLNCSMADVPTWQILAQMARQMDRDETAKLLETIRVRAYQPYNMTPLDRISMKLTDVAGTELILDCRPQKNDPYFSDYKSLLANLVKFGEKWLINGISSSSYSPIKNKEIVTLPDGELAAEAKEHFRKVIADNNGRKVFYCKTLKEVEEIVGIGTPIPAQEVSKDPDNLLLLLSEEKAPELYDDLCDFFADPENPFYDPSSDPEGSKAMAFIMATPVQHDVMEYISRHNLLPSAKVHASQGEETGKRLIQENLLFLLRFYDVTHTHIDTFDAPDDVEEEVDEDLIYRP